MLYNKDKLRETQTDKATKCKALQTHIVDSL